MWIIGDSGELLNTSMFCMIDVAEVKDSVVRYKIRGHYGNGIGYKTIFETGDREKVYERYNQIVGELIGTGKLVEGVESKDVF